MKTLHLVNGSVPVSLITGKFGGLSGKLRWGYLGRDAAAQKEWSEALGLDNRLFTSSAINDVAELRRSFYADWIFQLGKQEGVGRAWWMSLVREKNSETSDMFLNLCLLETAFYLWEKQAGGLLLVVENPALLKTIEYNARKKNIPVTVIGKHHPAVWREAAKGFADGAYAFIADLYHLFKNHKEANAVFHGKPDHRHLADGRRTVLLHTCIDANSIKESGDVADRYFTRLPDWLRSNGHTVSTIVWLYNITDYRSAYRNLAKKKEMYLVPERYFTRLDLLGAVAKVLAQRFVPQRDLPYGAYDVGALLDAEKRKQALMIVKARFILYRKMLEALKRDGVRPFCLVDMFENMGLEKPLVMDMREFFPEARIYSFQHATINPNMLKYYVGKGEVASCPAAFPDYIVANGEGFKEVMRRIGYPDHLLLVGPALRFLYLKKEKEKADAVAAKEFVLLTLPMMDADAKHLLVKVIGAFDGAGIPFVVKAHPMMRKEWLLDCLENGELPHWMHWADGPLENWISRAYCVLSIASASLFEAAVEGVPVVSVGHEGTLDMNPLGWWTEQEESFRTEYDVKQIREKVFMWYHMPLPEREQRMGRVSARLKNSIAGWDEKLLLKIFNQA